MLHEHHFDKMSNQLSMDPSIAFSKIEKHPLFKTKRRKANHTYDPSRLGFLDLPGELRNQVYRLTLTHHAPLDGARRRLSGIRLLRLCKKIHEEASSVLYHENTFTFGIEVNWSALQRIKLHCFPLSLAVWPAPTYHKWLRKMHIGISFSPGLPIDFKAPICLIDDIKAMRKAYDECWDDLDITYELCEGTAHRLTFTMAWLKFRFFEPIAHPNCKIKTKHDLPPLVRWCLERSLQQRDHESTLSEEERSALEEAQLIARDSYYSGMHSCIVDLTKRLVWGCLVETTPTYFQPGGFFGPQLFMTATGVRRRIYDQMTIYSQLNNSVADDTAREILLEDNKLRILAAMEMPNEKNLLIKECAELRIYFALQEAAMKNTALSRSLKEQ